MFCFSIQSSETESFASYSSQITNQIPCKNVPEISTFAKVQVLVGTSRDQGATVAGWSTIHSTTGIETQICTQTPEFQKIDGIHTTSFYLVYPIILGGPY